MLFRNETAPDINAGEDQSRKSGACRQHHPARKPWPASGCRRRSRQFFDLRHRQRDDAAAMGANGQMGERRLLLVGGQRVFDERAELIRVWMLPELEKLAHVLSDAAIRTEAVLSENGGV
jgi:hypothetical protein